MEIPTIRSIPNSSYLVRIPALFQFGLSDSPVGDSITQFSALTLQAYLQTQYIRRLDVINRGLSGFTSVMGYRALQLFLPASTPSSTWPDIKLVTVFFGANDACVPGEGQHVDLRDYVNTLRSLISYPVFNRRDATKTQVLIITPPPVNEHQFEKTPAGDFQRRAGITSQYARAARELARASGVHVLDLWTALMHRVGWNETMGYECCCEHIPYGMGSTSASTSRETQHIPGCSHFSESLPDAKYRLSDFLTDGLHLTKLGYDILFWELMKLIKSDIPECVPERLPLVLPEWRDALKIPDYCRPPPAN